MELADLLQQRFGLLKCEVVPSVPGDADSVVGLSQAGAAEIERYAKSRTS